MNFYVLQEKRGEKGRIKLPLSSRSIVKLESIQSKGHVRTLSPPNKKRGSSPRSTALCGIESRHFVELGDNGGGATLLQFSRRNTIRRTKIMRRNCFLSGNLNVLQSIFGSQGRQAKSQE